VYVYCERDYDFFLNCKISNISIYIYIYTRYTRFTRAKTFAFLIAESVFAFKPSAEFRVLYLYTYTTVSYIRFATSVTLYTYIHACRRTFLFIRSSSPTTTKRVIVFPCRGNEVSAAASAIAHRGAYPRRVYINARRSGNCLAATPEGMTSPPFL